MRSRTIMVFLVLSTLFLHSTTLKRSSWNLMSVCQEMNSSDINMTGIEEIQSQDGATIYMGEWAEYSNLTQLEAGYAYWIKGEAGGEFNSGESSQKLVKPLKRSGWNLMASCEDIVRDDINLTDIEEIQAQSGESVYINSNTQYSNLDGLVNGYGYWVKGNQGTLFTSKRDESDRVLSITGIPNNKVYIYESYHFSPTVNDANRDALTFSISNKPSWAEFNSTTGVLSGQPLDGVGVYSDVTISVSDQKASAVSLAPFSIEVKEARNIAKAFGKATQPPKDGYYYYKAPENAIDGNLSTNNHTQCSAPNNWLQVELPDATKVNKIVLHNISGQSARLNGSTVYLSNRNYTGSEEVNSSEALATLNSNMIQTIEPSTIEENRYLLIKGNPEGTNSCLHLSEVEVYGDLPTTPMFEVSEQEYFVQEQAIRGTTVATVTANDFQGDNLNYSLRGDVPFSIDNDGNILVNGLLDYGIYTFDVVASDGVNSSTTMSITANLEGQAENIAHKFGVATQSSDSSYGYYRNPAYAIDNNLSTRNMTADAGWLQVALPKGTQVQKVVIRNRTDSWTGRLSGTKVYVGLKDFNGTLIEDDYIGTLTSSKEPQTFTFDTLKDGDYVLLKEDDDNLHVLEVEVYGVTPAIPVFQKDAYTLGLKPHSDVGTTIGNISAVDYQGDILTYSIEGDVPFSIDKNGTIKVTEVVNHNAVQSFTFKVNVSDGENSSFTDVDVKFLSGSGVTLERWNGISGTAVSDLLDDAHYEDAPDETRVISALDINEDVTDNFGQKLTAILKPAQSGEYIFAIVGDDGTELRLDGQNIAYRSSWSSYQNWSASGKSETLRLEAGSIYSIEALHKESSGGEHVSVGWKQVGDVDFTTIPANELFISTLSVETSKPTFGIHESNHLIQGTTENGTVVVTIPASDNQNDPLTYNIVGDVPFSIDNSGNISVNGVLEGVVYSFDVLVSDGTNTVSTAISIQATSANAVEEAISSGSVLSVTEEELIQAARDEIESLRVGDDLLKQLYQDESISYDPGNRSQLINIVGDAHKVFPILYGDAGKNLAVAGTKENSRFAAFGAAPMEHFEDGENQSYEIQFKRLLAWLMTNNTDANISTKKIGLSFTHSDKSDIKNWISDNYPNWTVQECDRYSPDFSTCYNGVDLVITGWQTDEDNTQIVRTKLEELIAVGTPVLYLHTWYEVYNSVAHSIAELFEFSLPYGGNYWAKDKVSRDNVEAMQLAFFETSGLESIDTMFTHFQKNDYAFDWTQCKDGSNVGSQYDDCSDVVGLSSEFQLGASKVRSLLTTLDSNKKEIFTVESYRLQKLLVLIGDKLRQKVVYPMDKVETDDNEFMKSYYSDHAVYNYRKLNPAQKDMGNFSRSDFSHITPTTRTVNLVSKKNFRSTGAYALPGQTVKVTRNDNADVTVKVFINTLRSGATHQYQKNSSYNRPKYLQTPYFEVASGETIELTSPYGGTLQLYFDTNDLDVSLTFENIGEHPYWASSADDASFTQKLNAGEFDWAEVVTTGFEVHSKLDKMRESIADEKWGTAQVLAAATKRYMSNYPHVLAGFKGPGIDVVDEIHDFAEDKNLTINNLDLVKHMNADQATCGYGCSGNPYDAYWAFSPVGHGDVHELGHGLEKSRFMFEGFELHAITNPYSYYTKSKYNETTGGDPDCQNLPFQEVFENLQASVGEENATAYLQTNLWESSGWSQQVLVTIQAMMHTQKMGKLDNGWHLLARLHILEREISRADDDWEANRASLGFSSYTLDEFNAMRKNDWLLISFSFAAGLDFRDYLTMMGIEYSKKASDQVDSFGYPMVAKEFFVSTSDGYCKEDDTYGSFLDKSTLPVDGTTVFPY